MTPEEALIILALSVAAVSLIILVATNGRRNRSFQEFMSRKNKRRGGDK
ncbi:hypothetical protein [Pseudomonas sp. FH4]|nr:hypothetical protein [Pseudomonas sp. FH4]